jgi:hypothetical protein
VLGDTALSCVYVRGGNGGGGAWVRLVVAFGYGRWWGGCSGRDGGGGRWSRLDVVGGGARWPVTWPSHVGMREGGELVEMAA